MKQNQNRWQQRATISLFVRAHSGRTVSALELKQKLSVKLGLKYSVQQVEGVLQNMLVVSGAERAKDKHGRKHYRIA